jgi:CubicO group peptidase (beta-lactamase class C family)
MMVRFAIVLLLAATPAAAQWALTDSELVSAATRIDALVEPQSEAGLVSGVIVVARGDDILIDRAFGYADHELRVPNSVAMRFGVGSITKPMTWVLLTLLSQEGRLDLDSPVEAYIPRFPRGPRGGAPTLRQLRDHRSGVPHRVTDAIDETQPLRAVDIVERVREAGLAFEPGSAYLYSSAGYTCLARVIEIIEGESFEAVLARRIFGPARMDRAVSETGSDLMDMRARSYRLGSDGRAMVARHTPYKDLRFLSGAGSVYATARDILRFVRAARGGVFGDTVREQTFSGDGTHWQGWLGRTNGYEASVDYLAASDLTIVLLSNLQSVATSQIRTSLQSILQGIDVMPVPIPPPVAPVFEEPALLTGTYGGATISIIDGRLFRGENEFYPIAGRRYYIPGSGTVMRFRRNQAGMIDAILSTNAGGDESVLPRASAPGPQGRL